MYNYDYTIQYNDIGEELKNDTYKSDLLSCFYLENSDYDTINTVQDRLYEKYNGIKQFDDLINFVQNNQKFIPFELPLKTCSVLCFSYDYFYNYHPCLVDLHKDNTISDTNYNNMINLIKKK